MNVYKKFPHHYRIFNCTALFILSAFKLFAQNDSTENRFRFFLSGAIEQQIKTDTVDSAELNNFQLTNPFFLNYPKASAYLGNLGSALRTDYFGLHDDLNFYYRHDYFSSYHYNEHPISYDALRNIHSKLEYYRGAKKEQLFQFNHSQRLGKNFGFGLDYKSIISPSFYKHGTTISRSFDFYVIFESGNHRYSAFADYITNKTDNNINGGLVDESSLKNASGIDVKTLPVNLDIAQWFTREKCYAFRQQFNFKVASYNSPASKTDSTLKSITVSVPQVFVHHDFKYNKYNERFTSGNDSLWTINYYDSLTTVDSSSVKQFLNSLYFQSLLWGGEISLKTGANNQYLILKQHDIDSDMMHTSAFASGAIEINHQLHASVYYEQNIIGDATSAYMMKGSVSYTFANPKFGKLDLQLLNSKQPVYIMSNVYHTNHFISNNDFALINRSAFGINYSHKLFSAGVRTVNAKNFVYYNEAAYPEQLQSSLSNTGAYLKFLISLKKFHLFNDANINLNGDGSIVHLPLASLHSSIFYDDYFFKKALHAQFGFDLFYNTTYYADAFMPGLQEFYVQNVTKTGNYPFIDFYANARIRTAMIFIKLENIGSGWIGKNYFITPGYPLQGRGVRLGISWSFFN